MLKIPLKLDKHFMWSVEQESLPHLGEPHAYICTGTGAILNRKIETWLKKKNVPYIFHVKQELVPWEGPWCLKMIKRTRDVYIEFTCDEDAVQFKLTWC